MAVSTVVLLAADWLQRQLGERVIRAFERLMGLVLTGGDRNVVGWNKKRCGAVSLR